MESSKHGGGSSLIITTHNNHHNKRQRHYQDSQQQQQQQEQHQQQHPHHHHHHKYQRRGRTSEEVEHRVEGPNDSNNIVTMIQPRLLLAEKKDNNHNNDDDDDPYDDSGIDWNMVAAVTTSSSSTVFIDERRQRQNHANHHNNSCGDENNNSNLQQHDHNNEFRRTTDDCNGGSHMNTTSGFVVVTPMDEITSNNNNNSNNNSENAIMRINNNNKNHGTTGIPNDKDDYDNDDFDDSIDWTEAVNHIDNAILEQQEQKKKARISSSSASPQLHNNNNKNKNTANKTITGRGVLLVESNNNNNNKERTTTAAKPAIDSAVLTTLDRSSALACASLAKPIDSAAKLTASAGTMNRSTTARASSSTTTAGLVPDCAPPVQQKLAVSSSRSAQGAIIASIRPESWKQQQTDATVTTTTTTTTTATTTTMGCNNNLNKNQKNQNIAITTTNKNENSNNNNNNPQQQQQKILRQPQQQHGDPRQAGLPYPLQFIPQSVQPKQDSYRQFLIKYAQLSEPLLNGWTLYTHQKNAILRSLIQRRFILALDMGLGKTVIACVWAKAFVRAMGCKVFIICPVSLKQEWTNTIQKTTGLIVQQDENGNSKQSSFDGFSLDHDVYITSWAKIPAPPTCASSFGTSLAEKYIVIADEAHSIQNMNSTRTKDTLRLCDERHNCVGVLLLTGTPMKNGKPSNLFPLLRAVGHPFGLHQRSYEAHFCNGKETYIARGHKVWNATGSSNLQQLHELTKSHMMYLNKDDCLRESLPPIQREKYRISVSSKQQLQHQQQLQRLANIYNRTTINTNTNTTTANNKDSDKNDPVLGELTKLRYLGSKVKVDAVVKLTRDVLEKVPAVVIFTCFCDVAKLIHGQLSDTSVHGGSYKCELLTGETPTKKRYHMVDRFQKGLSAIFIATYGAGGVGITLTAANTMILVDRPWTPGDTAQAEDRIRRIGQLSTSLRSIWITTSFLIDQQIDNMLEYKNQTVHAVLKTNNKNNYSSNYNNSNNKSDGKTTTTTETTTCSNNTSKAGEGQKGANLSIYQLIKEILPKQSSSSSSSDVCSTTTTTTDGSSSNKLKQTSILSYSQQEQAAACPQEAEEAQLMDYTTAAIL